MVIIITVRHHGRTTDGDGRRVFFDKNRTDGQFQPLRSTFVRCNGGHKTFYCCTRQKNRINRITQANKSSNPKQGVSQMTNVKQAVTALDSALTELTDRIVQAQKRVADLEAQAERTEKRLARGTSDMSDELLTAEWSPIATKSDDRLPLPIELERVLRAQPISTYDAATLLGVPVAHVAKVLRDLRRAHKVVNAGTHDQPLWSWVLGDEGTTTDLTAKVEQLLRLRPMTLQELGDITGARRNRISGALVILRRHGIQIDNTGNGFRAVWSIQSPKSTRRGF